MAVGAAWHPNRRKAGPLLGDNVSLDEAVRAFERELILSRLERHGGNVKAARESLGLTRTTFHRYMKGLGITPPRGDPREE